VVTPSVVVPVAGGEPVPLDDAGRSRIGAAVRDAERRTGLQMCVAIGATPDDAHATAERLFVAGGLQERPAILLLVAPEQRQVEILTSPLIRSRVPDAACRRAVDVMVAEFATGALVDGVVAGVAHLAAEAEAPQAGAAGNGGDTDLPDVLG
jgi:uncharacterized membrane protein